MLSNAHNEPEYRLEHRLTGAVLLVIAGILIIPLLLRDPNPPAAALVSGTDEPIKIFKSRIEPHDSDQHSDSGVSIDLQGVDSDLETTEISNMELTSVSIGLPNVSETATNTSNSAAANSTDGTEPSTDGQKSALIRIGSGESESPSKPIEESVSAVKAVEPKSRIDNSGPTTTTATTTVERQTAGAGNADQSAAPVAAKPAVAESTSAKSAVGSRATEPAVNKPAATNQTSKEGVWVVRVGTFSKISNVTAVSRLLNDNGLKARTTPVQTSFGDATRIWLGPYSDKNSAVTVSAQLKALTGEKGYITRHTP